ncbi:MAG: glycogen debranching protein [Gammaproteobacteria bacterium]|nr:glycogen debranching protein [Gammaproteobacteria bacterium]NIR58763.1 glycogen debranching protein [Gammaproteobacteria bacterium]NIV73795.1 glycogen debranching protein [Gammaproteobacteria bacterium]
MSSRPGGGSGEAARAAQEGDERARALLRECASRDGFLASPTSRDNYRRIWARDGCIMGLAALQSAEPELVFAFRRTLETLADHQGPHGETPSNVDTVSGRVSYGGTTGRIDADLWFIIGCGQYWRRTQDETFLERMAGVLERVQFLLGAWELNARGLIYVPQAGDWADEYLHSGYVLYDQLLYLQAQREIHAIRGRLHGVQDDQLRERISRLRDMIRANYWFYDGDGIPHHVYHEVLYRNGWRAAGHCADRHWLPFFSPHGYGYRFDALANVLASLLGVADDHQRERVDALIGDELANRAGLLPAFHPVITPVDEDWEDLQMTFSYTFKNRPYEFHNGGLWPMITGFYVADLAARGHHELAGRYLDNIHAGNALEMDGEPWSFPEFVQGKTFEAGGTRHQGWSAAAAVMGRQALEGRPPIEGTADER